jgi:NADH dehydrogenase
VHWDRLALTTGSVTRTLPTPGVDAHALGLKTLVEAQYVHDHVLRQLELADSTDDPAERRARLTFLVVGAGYTGTETAAQLQHMTANQLDRFPRLSAGELRWILVDLAPAILPELGPRLGRAAMHLIRARGMEVRLGTTVTAMDDRSVTLSDGSTVDARTVVWTVGVTPPELVRRLGLPVHRGRLVVDEHLRLRDGVWAAGDSAAARDPFSATDADYPPTAQHAQRQGVVIGRNIAADLGHGAPRAFRHRDLGLVADLGRTAAVARPLGLSLTGLPAKIVTKAYHLYALPAAGNRLRVAADWVLNLVSRPIAAQLGLVDHAAGRLAAAEATRRRRRSAGAAGDDNRA